MNKELILKYKAEFDHGLNGGSILVKYANHKQAAPGYTDWHEDDSVWNSNLDYLIVINDDYAIYRKALAEGKTVERNYFSGIDSPNSWEPMKEDFTGAPRFYRIKPEEPRFKVGDWIRQGDRVFQYTYKDLQYDKANTTHCQKDKKWEPREGETCIFWDSVVDNDARISKFSHMKQEKYSTAFHTWNYCMPFTGTLPPHMKDSK